MTCAALLLASPAVATVNVWFMPGTTGSGGAKGSPRAFDWVSLTSQELSPSATDKDVVLHFMSSGGPVPTIHPNVTMSDGFLSPTTVRLLRKDFFISDSRCGGCVAEKV